MEKNRLEQTLADLGSSQMGRMRWLINEGCTVCGGDAVHVSVERRTIVIMQGTDSRLVITDEVMVRCDAHLPADVADEA